MLPKCWFDLNFSLNLKKFLRTLTKISPHIPFVKLTQQKAANFYACPPLFITYIQFIRYLFTFYALIL